MKDQEPKFDAEECLSLIGYVNSHFPGINPIGLVEDLNVVAVHMEIIGSEAPSADLLRGEGTKGLPQLGIKLKALN